MTQLKVITTSVFDDWLIKQPPKTRSAVKARLDYASVLHLGDHKRFESLIELRWKNGLRIYTFIFENKIFVILNGGN